MNHSLSPSVIVASLPVECFLISTCGEAAAGPAACAVPVPVKTHANAAVIARERKAPERECEREASVIMSGIIQPSPRPENHLSPTTIPSYDGTDDGLPGHHPHRRHCLPL